MRQTYTVSILQEFLWKNEHQRAIYQSRIIPYIVAHYLDGYNIEYLAYNILWYTSKRLPSLV